MGLSNAYVSQLVTSLDKLQKAYMSSIAPLQQAAAAALEGKVPDERDLVDAMYLMKCMSQLCEDLRKECDRAQRDLAKITCLSWTSKQVADPGLPDKIQGQLARGEPQIKMVAVIPKRGTDAYNRICRSLGVPQEVIDAEMYHVHWPSFVEHCSLLLSQGKKLPDGIDSKDCYPSNTFAFDEEPDYVVSLRKTKS